MNNMNTNAKSGLEAFTGREDLPPDYNKSYLDIINLALSPAMDEPYAMPVMDAVERETPDASLMQDIQMSAQGFQPPPAGPPALFIPNPSILPPGIASLTLDPDLSPDELRKILLWRRWRMILALLVQQFLNALGDSPPPNLVPLIHPQRMLPFPLRPHPTHPHVVSTEEYQPATPTPRNMRTPRPTAAAYGLGQEMTPTNHRCPPSRRESRTATTPYSRPVGEARVNQKIVSNNQMDRRLGSDVDIVEQEEYAPSSSSNWSNMGWNQADTTTTYHDSPYIPMDITSAPPMYSSNIAQHSEQEINEDRILNDRTPQPHHYASQSSSHGHGMASGSRASTKHKHDGLVLAPDDDEDMPYEYHAPLSPDRPFVPPEMRASRPGPSSASSSSSSRSLTRRSGNHESVLSTPIPYIPRAKYVGPETKFDRDLRIAFGQQDISHF